MKSNNQSDKDISHLNAHAQTRPKNQNTTMKLKCFTDAWDSAKLRKQTPNPD